MEPRVITNDTEYREALEEIESLAADDPASESEEGRRLGVLAVLAEAYEKDRFTFDLPSPLDAIRFRMEEQGLRQVDLIPYFGTSAKVSEVLSGKRQLTLAMIRRLSEELAIPANILVQDTQAALSMPSRSGGIDWTKFPVAEIAKKHWIRASRAEVRHDPQSVMQRFFSQLGEDSLVALRCRAGERFSEQSEESRYAIQTWAARVLLQSRNDQVRGKYTSEAVNEELRKALARLSVLENGPLLARELLSQNGISLAIVPHLKGTKLDGAAMLTPAGTPVIGLTLRYDRLDNFWFVLTHELVHIEKHLKANNSFFDDLDAPSSDRQEMQADQLTLDTFVPRTDWRSSGAFRLRTAEAIKATAAQYGIHPAIVAGRLRKELADYSICSALINGSKVRQYFPEYSEK